MLCFRSLFSLCALSGSVANFLLLAVLSLCAPWLCGQISFPGDALLSLFSLCALSGSVASLLTSCCSPYVLCGFAAKFLSPGDALCPLWLCGQFLAFFLFSLYAL